MERFFSKVPKRVPTPSTTKESSPILKETPSNPKESLPEAPNDDQIGQGSSKRICLELNFGNLPADPARRKPIEEYDANVRDEVRRAYLLRGPCQPRTHKFKQIVISSASRRFQVAWFDEFPTWLEYSIHKEAAFCLQCYLFKSNSKKHSGPGGGDPFVVGGFTNWKKKEKLHEHVGGPKSAHNEARLSCEALMNEKHQIKPIWNKKNKRNQEDYLVRLNASLDVARLLLRQRLPFRGHDESECSLNKGNYREFLKFLAQREENLKKVCSGKANKHLKLVAPSIQKDLVNACAVETTNKIMKDIGDSLFSILIDEARDVSTKEQMAIVLRYVNNLGQVIESYVGIVHVKSTTSLSLKEAIDDFFSKHNLSISNLRGQGYDGASNMRGEFNGLKALILKENSCAYYVHCFAHQLQLALVGVAKRDEKVEWLFDTVARVVSHVGGSSKRCDMLLDAQAMKVAKTISRGEIPSGRGLNQETKLKRSGDTRWSSHYNSLVRLIDMFSSVIDVLVILRKDPTQRLESSNLLDSLQSFDFAFSLHLMRSILGITNELSQALQRKNQDIVNAMELVKLSKQRLQLMRDEGWDSLLDEVSSFCVKNSIDVPKMDDVYVLRGRSRRNIEKTTCIHHFNVEVFYPIIDMQLQELNNRFGEVHTHLLLCMASLDPQQSFSRYDKEKLIDLATFYPRDFSNVELSLLGNQLDTYILHLKSDEEFSNLKGIGELAEKMVQTRKNDLYPLVYKLLTLALILPVATASVERVFSAMNLVKTYLRNRMGDQWMADCLITYIEKKVFNSIDNDVILERYQAMSTRIEQLP